MRRLRLHVHTFGDPDGRPLVCLHGLTGTGARYRKLGAERLAGRRVLAPDLRGHGHSPAEPPWDVATLVADLVETLDALGVKPTDWIGYSYGGLTLATLAAAHPERVERVALLEPALALRPSVCLDYARRELDDESYASEAEAVAALERDEWIFHAPREALEEEVRTNMVCDEDGRLRYRYSATAAIVAWSEMARPAPPSADAPTLIVVGERSPLRVDLGRYPHARVVTVPGGHSVLWDAFAPTADALEAFLG